MYAAKNMKDAYDDVVTLRNSSNDRKYGYFQKCKERTEMFCIRMAGLIADENGGVEIDVLMQAYREMVKGYTDELSALYRASAPASLTETEISTIVNFNRELYTSYKSILLALKDFLLDKAAAEKFDELPGFIR
jgi:phosphate:Na+ symporter